MSTLKFDGKFYETETLTEKAQQHIAAIKAIDRKLGRLRVQSEIARTARNVHVQLLKPQLPDDPMHGDTIKLG